MVMTYRWWCFDFPLPTGTTVRVPFLEDEAAARTAARRTEVMNRLRPNTLRVSQEDVPEGWGRYRTVVPRTGYSGFLTGIEITEEDSWP